MIKNFKCFVILVFISNNIISAHSNESCEDSLETDDDFRLPTSIKPENYKLEIFTHLNDSEGFFFKGSVKITINIDEFCNNITLHTRNLTILTEDIKLYEIPNNNFVDIKNVEFNNEHDFMIIFPQKSLLKSTKYVVEIPFEGTLNANYGGYYRQSYHDNESNQTVWLSVTQFEPAYARRAFPCFDEPELKATFDISLGHHKMYTALSNMPLKSTRLVDDLQNFVMDTFETSVKMSTYLVAYSISDFAFKEVEMKNNLTLRIYARPEAIEQAEYAADITPKIIKFFEEYLQIKYPLLKLDMMAVPNFPGGMENWGLINYGEEFLLLDPKTVVLPKKREITSIITHEVAHQWFGNLVTMKWWNNVWLNEGFATYSESLGIDNLYPEWKAYDDDLVAETLKIFKIDSLNKSQPINPVIKESIQIYVSLGPIAYKKGSLIIRMCKNILSEKVFHSGLSNYLKKHQYGNTVQDDLWDSLAESANKEGSLAQHLSIKTIMDSWTLQVGYPVIQVIRDYETNSAIITQSRYISDPSIPKSELKECWWIPLTYTDSTSMNFTSTRPQDWMTCNEENKPTTKIIENLPDQSHWIIFNNQLSAFYRIQYDEHNYKLIIATLRSDDFHKIHVLNRVQFISDVLDFAFTGRLDCYIALEMLDYLKQETEYLPWKTALSHLAAIEHLLFDSQVSILFRAYIHDLINPIYNMLGGIAADPAFTDIYAIEHHKLISKWACYVGVHDCTERSKIYFDEWMSESEPDNVNNIPLNLRETIYCTAIRNGNISHWNFLLERFVNTKTETKSMIIEALSCSKDKTILEKYLELSLNSSLIQFESSQKIFNSVASNEAGYHLAQRFLFNRFGEISKRGEGSINSAILQLELYIIPLAEQMTTQKELNELQEFVNKHSNDFEKVENIFEKFLETIKLKTQWRSNILISFASKLKVFKDFDSEFGQETVNEIRAL